MESGQQLVGRRMTRGYGYPFPKGWLISSTEVPLLKTSLNQFF